MFEYSYYNFYLPRNVFLVLLVCKKLGIALRVEILKR